MSSILCLAHYCDTHGPTPLMVTEGLPVGCISCYDDESIRSRRPSIGVRSLNPADGLAGIHHSGRTGSASSDKENGDREALRSERKPRANSSAIETPPASPRISSLQSTQFSNSHRRDSSFRKTYDENDKKRAIPCENCALTLPKKTNEAPKSKVDNNGPILRTRKPYERVSRPADGPSPPKSASSSDSESAVTSKPAARRESRSILRGTTSSSGSSFNSTHSHDHFLDYTSTHEPLAPISFSIIRASCLRIFTCETLPPSSNQNVTSPTSPYINNPFSSGPSPSSAGTSSSGPIFFGDPQAGYTTAYIFRIPDPNARGRRRVYALMALSTHGERLAMLAFSFLEKAFHDLAAWIQGLAEAELEKAQISATSPRVSGGGDSGGNGGFGSSHHSTPTSSFLSGRNRGGDGKFAGVNLKAKGLAELVGLPDFFIELHARFVRLLVELSMVVGA